MTAAGLLGRRESDRYIVALDGLRAIAIIVVVCHNSAPRLVGGGLGERVYKHVTDTGWAGVQLFFVLSGFLITGIILDSKDHPHFFRNFYARRALRIFPAYYLVLFLALVLGPHFFPTHGPGVQLALANQAWLWTYTPNIAMLRHGGWLFASEWLALDHTWSLGIEEQFYLVWPLLLFALPQLGIATVGLAIVAAAPVLRFAMLWRGMSPEVVYAFTLSRLDALAMGSLLALVVRRVSLEHCRNIASRLIAAGGVPLLAILLLRHGLDSEDALVQTLGFSALGVFCSGGLLAVVALPQANRLGRFLSTRPMTAIGRYSYGLYLYHGLLMPFFRRLFPVDDIGAKVGSRLAAVLVFTAFVFLASTGAALLSWHVVERPFLLMKARFTR
jgi:peptidoglycan/LPS O-acetylase OafA/YrhL